MNFILEWNYKSEIETSSGYEDVIHKLKLYTKDKYINATNEDRIKMVDEVKTIYRAKNIYPITYYNQEGIYKEIKKCINKEVNFDEETLDLKLNQGQNLCRFLFPNMTTVQVRAHKNMRNRFYDELKLQRAIEFSLKYKKGVTPSELRSSFEMICGGVATNFKTMNAKALYEKYCPKNGVIYDYACGFGGRMLGALASKNDYIYIGVEPCIETYTHLNELGLNIEHVTQRENSYKLFCMGSEDFIYGENVVDFAFSSPPYFNLEKYSNEPTQCYNRFPNIEDWFEGYVKPTIKNTYIMLKPNTYYAVNIADFKYSTTITKYVDRWIYMAEEIGFKYEKQIYMKLKSRQGNGHHTNEERDNKEGIFIFRTIKN